MKTKLKYSFLLLLPLLSVMLLVGVGTNKSLSNMAETLHLVTVAKADDDTTKTDEEKKKEEEEAKKKEEDAKKESKSDGNYSKLQVPARLATAYHDGFISAQSDAADDNTDTFETFYENVKQVVTLKGNNRFSNIGALYGQLGLSSNSGTSNVAQLASIDKSGISSLDTNTGTTAASAYWVFGRAVSNLNTTAAKTPTSNVGTEGIVSGFTGVPSVIAGLGVKILKDFSPAPVVLAFNDSSKLNSDGDNVFVKIINSNKLMQDIVTFFGSPAPGFPGVSISVVITLAVVLLSTGLALGMVLFNGRQFGMSFRNTLLKIAIIAVAIPAGAKLYDVGLNLVSDITEAKAPSKAESVISNNLMLGDWANATKFAIPEGTTLNVSNNRFVFTPENVKAINLMVAQRIGIGTNEKDIENYINKSLSGNTTAIKWSDPIDESTNRPWKTVWYDKVSDALGSNSKISEDSELMSHIENVGYLAHDSLVSSQIDASNGVGSFSMVAGQADGLSPIAAYNIVNTDFTQDGWSVKSNLQNVAIPTIAPSVTTYYYGGANTSELAKDKPPLIVSGVLSLVMIFAALSALTRIITAGFGGMFHGGGASAFGSVAGAGEFIGGIIALFAGVLGLSMLIVGLQAAINGIWEMVYTAVTNVLSNIDGGTGILATPDSMLDKIRDIPFVGGMLAHLVNGFVTLLVSAVALFALPKFVKIPIEAFGTWISGLPTSMSERAQAMAAKFTGDYRSGGRVGGNHMANAAANASRKAASQRQAVRTGALMMAGAGLRSLISTSNSKDSVSDKETDKGKDTTVEDKNNETTGTENTTDTTSAVNDTVSTDTAGVDERVTDNEQSTEATNSDDTTASDNTVHDESVSDNTTAGEHTTSDSKSVDGKSVGDTAKQGAATAASVAEAGKDAGMAKSGENVANEAANVAGEASNITASSSNESVVSDDSRQDVTENDASQNTDSNGVVDNSKSLHDDLSVGGSVSDNYSALGDQVAENVATNASVANDVNSSSEQKETTNVNENGVTSSESVSGGTRTSNDTKSNTQNNMQNTSSENAAGNNESMSGVKATKPEGSQAGRGSKFMQSVKNTAGVVAAGATGVGDVTAKQQAAVGAAHMAAGVMGAQNVTQHAVDNINARKGRPVGGSKTGSKTGADAKSANKPLYTEDAIQKMEERDKARNAKPTSTPVTNNAVKNAPKTPSRETKQKSFLETINRQSKTTKK